MSKIGKVIKQVLTGSKCPPSKAPVGMVMVSNAEQNRPSPAAGKRAADLRILIKRRNEE